MTMMNKNKLKEQSSMEEKSKTVETKTEIESLKEEVAKNNNPIEVSSK